MKNSLLQSSAKEISKIDIREILLINLKKGREAPKTTSDINGTFFVERTREWSAR